MNTMGASMKPLVKNEFFLSLMEKSANYPILGLLMGTFFTTLIQSSSASIGVLQTLASATDSTASPAVISIMQAFPLLIGANIGTTITAFLASIGARKEAHLAALTHTVFNLVGGGSFHAAILSCGESRASKLAFQTS